MKHRILWSIATFPLVAAFVFAGTGLAAPRVASFDRVAAMPIAAPTPAAQPVAVASAPEPVVSVAETPTPPPVDAVATASQAPVAELPLASPAPVPAPAPKAVHAPHADIWFGLYVPGAPSSMSPVRASEARVGRHAQVVNFFVADSEQFPAPRCANIVAHGSTPLITLEFWSVGSQGLDAINNGSKDAYIRRFAADAKAFHKKIWLRPFHEMNTHHYPWGATGSNTPAKLVAAYRHVHDIFAAEGATNVKFVWCPNVGTVSAYYPGDAYADYAAIDGYNTGTPWQSFATLFGKTYEAVAAVSPKPIFIAETACAAGPRKAAWVADMFAQIATAYPRISGVCWFDDNKEHDWRVNSSPSSAAALRVGLAGS